jgi:ribonuclease III
MIETIYDREEKMNKLAGSIELEKKIGYSFHNQELLIQALTHSSFSNEDKGNLTDDYERLEFLGDAVLELAVSEHLFMTKPDMYEGNMTKTRASIVCEFTLAVCARNIVLDKYILLGKGEELTGGRNRDSIISDVFEALIGAIYLDGGFDVAKEFVMKYVLEDVEDKIMFYDSKTILQEFAQESGKKLEYEVVGESGPSHDKVYYAQAIIDGKIVGKGEGKMKKRAEQQAAYDALMILKKK